MASCDTKSLFVNISLQETIDLSVEHLFKNKTHVDNLLKNSLRELFMRTMSEPLILFDQEFYKQHDGVAMVRIYTCQCFFCYHEKVWFQNCPFQFKPVISGRYVDDKFLPFG